VAITIEFLNSLRARYPRLDEEIDKAIASLVTSSALSQIRKTIEAEHPDMPLHEKMALLTARYAALKSQGEGRRRLREGLGLGMPPPAVSPAYAACGPRQMAFERKLDMGDDPAVLEAFNVEGSGRGEAAE
jgi:hypothetical protein